MAAETNRVAPLNMALAAIGVLLVAVGFVTSSIAGATMSSYPYFGIGVVIVIFGMAFVASGLIYSPRKADPIKQA